MENPDKDILKNLLQDTFSDWEPEPSDQTWHAIQQAIQPAHVGIGTWMKRWFIPSVGLFLLIGSLLVWHSEANRLQRISHNANKQTLLATNNSSMLPVLNTNKQTKVISVASVKAQSTNLKAIAQIQTPNNLTEKIGYQSKLTHDRLPKNIRVNTALDKTSTEVTVSIAGLNNNQQSSELTASTEQVETPNTRVSTKHFELSELSEKKLTYFHNGLDLPKLSALILSKDPKPVRKERIFSLSITPLQTYRIITVTNNEVLKLQRNSLINPERNGVAVELGMNQQIQKKSYLRANFAYLMMKQWAQYQVSTDGVLVNNTKTSNTIETILETKIENKTLEMFGIKADFQQFIREAGRNRYFLSLGPQVMYDPTNRQANLFINASAGFQHTVNNNYFITIEPIASYSINNINDKNSLLQTNVYNLGLKMGLSFRSR